MMKKLIPPTLFLLSLLGCEKEANTNSSQQAQFLQEYVFNGHTQWIVTRMEADTEREINGKSTTVWTDEYNECRKDNIYQFGTLGVNIASININEGDSPCTLEEPDFVSQGLLLDFSTDYKKAAAFIKGVAMAKLFELPYDSKVKSFDFNHSWEFEEMSQEKVIVKAFIPADQSAEMVDSAATVWITFEQVP